PDDTGTVGSRCPVGDADGIVGHLARRAGGPVPGIDLPRAALVGGERQVVGRVPCPVRERDPRGAEALLPDGNLRSQPTSRLRSLGGRATTRAGCRPSSAATTLAD